jgi:putative oxidoreductase
MNILLWVLQVLLALAFFAHGCLFLFPPAAVVEQMNASLPRWFQLFLGVAEVLAAVGLTLPGIARIQPWLVSWAAAGIMIVMISATVFHLSRGEVSSAITTAVLLVLATVVAYMRWRVMPIAPRLAARRATAVQN